ncbi:MAG TPA: hypothetical protein VMN82_12495 [Thermoanaerobaculia bacterium]|nr:hypothetical protein [Thermoanaerobaculia bacterium]
MRRPFRAALPAAAMLALALLTPSPLTSQQGEVRFDIVRGNWTITSKNVENDEWVTKTVEIHQDGTRIWGRFQGPNQEGGIEGTIENHHIVFATKTKNVLTFRGQVTGDTMSGNYGIHGRHAPFKAVRTSTEPSQ